MNRIDTTHHGIARERVPSLPPVRQVRIRVRVEMVVDVLTRRVVWRIAPDVRMSFPLVHADIVNLHDRGEDHRSQVDGLPVAYAR